MEPERGEGIVESPAFESMELVSSGWINKYVLTYRMPDGRAHVYESASRKKPEAYERELRRAEAARSKREAGTESDALPLPDALSIVGRTADDEILLIREFRYPVNDWCVAFPAGLVEPGEDLAACADRELLEETGYRVVRPADGSPSVRLMPQAGLSSTGMTDEQVHVCFARIERAGEAKPEENELIEPFTVPMRSLRRFLDENRRPIGTRCQLVLEMYAHAFPQDKDGGYL